MERNLFKKKVHETTENQSSSNQTNNATYIPSSSSSMNPPPNSSRRPTTSFIPKHTCSGVSSSIHHQNDEAFKPEFDYSKHGLEQHDISLEGRGVFRVYTMNHHPQQILQQPTTNNINNNLPIHLMKTRKCESVLVFIHGAGLSSLSWCLCMQNLRQLVLRSSATNNVNINFMRSPPTPMEMTSGQPNSSSEAFDIDDYEYCAIDLRGHGSSHSVQDNELSIDTLVDDVIALLQQVYRGKKNNFILVGHSLGGSIAVRCAHKMDSIEETERRSVQQQQQQQQEIMTVKGVIIIDMVEGSALTSLPNTRKFIESRPNKFKNMESAIKWSVQHGVVNNISSAVISIPSQLMHVEDGDYYTWRTNLTDSEQYWTAWFTNMSNLFLEVRGLKLLMITSTDILDKELTIAQMQGKFQMKVLNKAGHCIQEDDPAHCSEVIFSFLHRFRL